MAHVSESVAIGDTRECARPDAEGCHLPVAAPGTQAGRWSSPVPPRTPRPLELATAIAAGALFAKGNTAACLPTAAAAAAVPALQVGVAGPPPPNISSITLSSAPTLSNLPRTCSPDGLTTSPTGDTGAPGDEAGDRSSRDGGTPAAALWLSSTCCASAARRATRWACRAAMFSRRFVARRLALL